jgi:hypothetical protein
MYSVALERIVAYSMFHVSGLLLWRLLYYMLLEGRHEAKDQSERTLFNFCAASRPPNSSCITESPFESFFSVNRKLGTLSRSAAILSFRFVR